MFCPHCHNKIPDGSNICPLCYSNLAGMKMQQPQAPRVETGEDTQRAAKKPSSAQGRSKKAAYTKGSRGSKKKQDVTPMIIAFGLIVILVVIIVMIVRSMFGVGDVGTLGQKPTAEPAATPQQNFIVFGETPTPRPQIVTPTPALEITPTPAPQTATYSYNTLRKNDQGQDVMMLQKALAELGYLNGAEDGIYGTGTQTAVKNFQKDNGLDADGIAGKMTLEVLYGQVTITPIPEVTVGPGDIMDLPG